MGLDADRSYSPADCTRVWIGTIVQPKDRTMVLQHESVVGIDGTGHICFVGRLRELPPELTAVMERLDSEEGAVFRLQPCQFLIPGLVDCHIHAPQFSFTGTATDVPLMDWLDRYTFPTESSLSCPVKAGDVYSQCVRMGLNMGTTTALYFGTRHVEGCKALAAAAIRLGQRALVGKVNMDRHCPDHYVETTEESVQGTVEWIEYAKGLASPLVYPVITPRFLPTCSDELLTRLGGLAAQHGVHVQSHISESVDQIAFCKALASEHQNMDRDALVFDRCGLLTPRTVLAHAVHLDKEELRLLQERGSSIAHCPLSNFFFAGRALRTKQALDMGVKVGLGTDVAGGYSPSMLNAVRSAVIASRVVEDSEAAHLIDTHGGMAETERLEIRRKHRLDYKEALWLGTMGGAQCLGLEKAIGSFEVGKAFDAVLLNDSRGGAVCIFPATDSDEDRLQKIVNNGDDRHVLHVWVQGRLVKP